MSRLPEGCVDVEGCGEAGECLHAVAGGVPCSHKAAKRTPDKNCERCHGRGHCGVRAPGGYNAAPPPCPDCNGTGYAPSVPSAIERNIVWELHSKTTSMLFASRESAVKFLSGYPGSVSGGFDITERFICE